MIVNLQIRVLFGAAMFMASACSSEPDRDQERVAQDAPDSTAQAEGPAATARQDTGAMESMPGMDHGNMPSGSTQGAQNEMPAMDHAAMRRTAGRPAGAAMAPGMDHSRMAQPLAQPGAAAGVRGDRTTPPTPVDADGTSKLKQLMTALLGDSVVRARVAGDTALLRRWVGDPKHSQH